MADREQLYQALRNADAAGDKAGAQRLASYIQSLPAEDAAPASNPQLAGVPGADPSAQAGNRNAGQPEPQRSIGDRIEGGIETGLALGTGIVGGTAGMIGGTVKGLAGSVMDGTFGTQAGVRQVEQSAADGMQALTYAPRTEAGQEYTGKIGEAMAATVPAMGLTSEMAAIGRGAAQVGKSVSGYAAATNAPLNAADAALAAGPKAPLRDLVRKPAAPLSGVGAAKAKQESVRAQRFERFGIKPTEGQLTRDKQQIKFERETAKMEEGKPISDHLAEQNAQVGRVMNQMIEDTGAEIAVTPENLYDAGKTITSAVEMKAAAKKEAASVKYAEARAAGEMAEPVDVTNLVTFVKANKGKDKVAPIVTMIEAELKQNAKEVGGNLDKLTLTPTRARTMMTLDAAEDLRQAINKYAEPGTPNQPMGISAIKVLDKATEGKGGAIYKEARRAWENYSKEFADHGAIAKLMGTKGKTADRAVPFAEAFDHLILNGDKDSVRHVFRVLEAHEKGADPAIVAAGQQAARELRGALVSHIKETMFSNGGADAFGNVVGSEIKIKRLISKLDRKGVLEPTLGKAGAQQLRDLAELAVDMYTTPDGTVNNSNNMGALVAGLDKIHNKIGGLPAAGYVTKHVRDHVKSQVTSRRVEKALNPVNSLARQQNKF